MPRLLLVGSQNAGAIENFFRSALSDLGCDVALFDPSQHVADGFFARVRRRLYDRTLYTRVNECLLEECRMTRPDVVWVFKGIEIMPETILGLKRMGVLVANYNPDHPYIRTSVTHGGGNVAECVPLYDVYFSYHRELVRSLEQTGVWLPFGFHLPELLFRSIERDEEIPRACFVGTVDAERAKTLAWLGRGGVAVDVFGPLNRFAKRLVGVPNIRLSETVFDRDFWRVMRAYRVQLNFFREHNRGSHNQRTFEVPAAGGILLTPDSVEQREFFAAGSEIHFYGTNDEMRDQILRLLSVSTSTAAGMRLAARKRSLASGYSYADRAGVAYAAILKALRVSGLSN